MVKKKTGNVFASIIITVAFAVLGVTAYILSYMRLIESVRDLGLSFGYYFCEIFGITHNITPTVCEKSGIKNELFFNISFDELKDKSVSFFTLLADKNNITGWLNYLGGKIGKILKVLAVVLPCLFISVLLLKLTYARGNNMHNKDTLPLKMFKNLTNVIYVPVRKWTSRYVSFLKERKWLLYLWGVIWFVNLNIATVILELSAYFLFIAVSFDLSTLPTQLVKLFLDLQLFLRHCPWWMGGIIAYLLFNNWRKKLALNRLRHFEARNCGFINELPVVSITCGSMGKKKTTVITDMALSQEVMFRQRALEILQNADMKFPYFPWILFEKELRKCMEYGKVYNLATVKEWVKLKRQRFLKHRNKGWQLYGYDCGRYNMAYDDVLKVSSLFDVLETYALSYFIYVIECSLIVANYSVRTDNKLIDGGNFPMWATDFFSENRRPSRHSHILDFDVLRLGKKVLENNPNAGSFEFGAVAITEIGKERGNNLELKEVKKGGVETNQKNDLFNSWLKMCRHSATVDNFPFIKVFTDEQRPESWGADARDLCEIIQIVSSGDMRLALPFYTFEDMVSEWAFNGFMRIYYDFRFRRGDNTLLVYLLKGITSWLWKRNARIYNRYGYSVLKIEKERGTMDGKAEKKKYYLANRKIYANRFSTDCFSDYFNDLAKKSKVGLREYMEYVTEKATVEELKMQNSYFINSLYKDADKKSSAEN